MRQRALKHALWVFGVSLSWPAVLLAEGITCPGNAVIVLGADDRAAGVCEAASESIKQLASCNLTVPSPITVEITQSIPGHCLGLYHCDEDLIQLLPIEDYANYLAKSPEGLFSHLTPQTFFDSVLRHELAHASLDSMPCPFEACPATKEFVAYNMQIWLLAPAERAPFDQRASELERSAFQDGVSAMALMLVPDLFVTNAYAYLRQLNDPCHLMSDIANGEVIFDLPPR